MIPCALHILICDRPAQPTELPTMQRTHPSEEIPWIKVKVGRNRSDWCSAPGEPEKATLNPSHFLVCSMKRFMWSSQTSAFPFSSFFCATLCHDGQPCRAAYLRSSSSHLNQRVLPGLWTRKEAGSSNSPACQRESLHSPALLFAPAGRCPF